jgi:hypothetical protein
MDPLTILPNIVLANLQVIVNTNKKEVIGRSEKSQRVLLVCDNVIFAGSIKCGKNDCHVRCLGNKKKEKGHTQC